MFKEIKEIDYINHCRVSDLDYWSRKLGNFDKQLFNSKLNRAQKKKLFKDNIDIVNLELSSYCNRECGYCPVSKYKRNYKSNISNKLLNKILSELALINYDKQISLNLYNEPLENTETFLNHIKHIRKHLPNSILHTNSNGDFIKNNKIFYDLEKAGLNKIKLTLHAPKNKKWEFEMMKNFFNKFIKKINFDIVATNRKELKCFLKYKNLAIVIQSPDWQSYGNDRSQTIETAVKINQRIQPCVKPFRQFTIYMDGSITQCCEAYYDKKTYKLNLIDNLNKNSIFDAYTSEALSNIRKELFDWSEKRNICATCSTSDLSVIEDDKLRKNILNN